MKLSILFTILLTGCASLFGPIYEWKLQYPKMEYRSWTKVSLKEVVKACPGSLDALACTTMRPFANICDTLSIYSEDEAKHKFDYGGMSIYDHEQKHCDGWVHQ